MFRPTILMRAATLERDVWFVELATFFSFAAWVPDGFRPIWLPLVFALGGVAVTLAMSGMNRLFGFLTDRFVRRERHETIEVTDVGFSVSSSFGRRNARCAWADIEAVYAFKRDLGTTDLVCLAVVTHDAIVEVNESGTAWNELVEALPAHLAGCEAPATWNLAVVAKPFEPQLRCIFGDAASTETDDARTIVETLGQPDEAETEPNFGSELRAYLGAGTSGTFLAVVGLLGLVAIVHGPRSLAGVAVVALVEIVLSRAVLFSVLARRSVV